MDLKLSGPRSDSLNRVIYLPEPKDSQLPLVLIGLGREGYDAADAPHRLSDRIDPVNVI